MSSVDELIPVRDAGGLFPSGRDGKPVATATIRRWGKVGCRGIRLELSYVGGRDFVSRPAVARFIEQSTAAGRDRVPKVETSPERRPPKG